MTRRLLGALLLAALPLLPSATPPPPTLCRVQVFSTPTPDGLGRALTIQTVPGCPPGGYARVRLTSRLGGSLPDNPPGAYTVRPGAPLTRVSWPWWWPEWLSASGVPYRIPEVSP